MAPGPSATANVNVAEEFESGAVVYISAINGGTCVSVMNNSDLLHQTTAQQSDSQYWAVEYEGDQPNKVAFRHCGSGRYMKTTGGRGYNRIKLDNDKTWWEVHAGRAPGTLSFKAADQSNAWMCNQQGRNTEGAQCYVWPWEDGWWFTLMWHLKAAPGYKGKGIYDEKAKFVKAGSGWEEADQKYAAMHKEIEQLKVKAGAGVDESVMKKREQEAARREQELKDNNAKLQKEAEEWKAKSNASADDSDVKRREQEVAKREQELKDADAKRQQELQSRQQNLARQEQQLKDLEAKLAERERNAGSSGNSSSQPHANGGSDSALRVKLDEVQQTNDALRKELERARNATQTQSLDMIPPPNSSLVNGDTSGSGSGANGSADDLARQNAQLKAEMEQIKALNQRLQGIQGPTRSGSGTIQRNFPGFDSKLLARHSLSLSGNASGTYKMSGTVSNRLLAFDEKLLSPFVK